MGFWDSISDAFSRDGVVTTFCEKIPIVGHATAGIQALAGNSEHAKRALATSTGSLITTAGAIRGFIVGGPIGAVAGGAAAAQLGIAAEWGISTTIHDDKVKGDVGEVSLGHCAGEAVLGGASGLLGGGGASAVGKQAMKAFGSEVAKKVASEAVGSAIRTGVITTIGQVVGKYVVSGCSVRLFVELTMSSSV